MGCSAKFNFIFLPEDKSPTMSSSVVLTVLIILEFVDLWKGVVRVDHFAHLGGYLAGIIGAQLLKIRAERPQEKNT